MQSAFGKIREKKSEKRTEKPETTAIIFFPFKNVKYSQSWCEEKAKNAVSSGTERKAGTADQQREGMKRKRGPAEAKNAVANAIHDRTTEGAGENQSAGFTLQKVAMRMKRVYEKGGELR
jgi:hypothetical protein